MLNLVRAGTIPPSWSNISALQTLSLHNNRLTGNRQLVKIEQHDKFEHPVVDYGNEGLLLEGPPEGASLAAEAATLGLAGHLLRSQSAHGRALALVNNTWGGAIHGGVMLRRDSAIWLGRSGKPGRPGGSQQQSEW